MRLPRGPVEALGHVEDQVPVLVSPGREVLDERRDPRDERDVVAQTLERGRNSLDFTVVRQRGTLFVGVAKLEVRRPLLGNQSYFEAGCVVVGHCCVWTPAVKGGELVVCCK